MPHSTSTGYAKRSSVERITREEKQIYYLVTEGFTEIKYFEHIRSIAYIKNPNVDIRFLSKTFSEQRRTNPEDLFAYISNEIYKSETHSFTIKWLVEELDHWLRSTHKIIQDFSLDTHLSKYILKYLKNKGFREDSYITIDNLKTDGECYKKLFYDAIQKSISDEISDFDINEFREYIQKNIPSIDTDVDKICMIIDRDKRRRGDVEDEDEELDTIYGRCQDRNIKFFISNPCFEFWILLHLDDVEKKFDPEKMLDDPIIKCPEHKESGKGDNQDPVRYSFNTLKKYLPNYTKSKTDFSGFSEYGMIKRAIQNSKKYCTSFPELKNNIGSNLCFLVEELLHPEKIICD